MNFQNFQEILFQIFFFIFIFAYITIFYHWYPVIQIFQYLNSF